MHAGKFHISNRQRACITFGLEYGVGKNWAKCGNGEDCEIRGTGLVRGDV